MQMVRVASALAGIAEIEVLMPKENSENFRKLCDDYGVRYKVFPISRLTRELKSLATFALRSPFEIILLYKYIKQSKPDLIHAWGGSWQFKAAVLSRITGVPLVWLINDTKVPNAVMSIFRQFTRFSRAFIFASHRSYVYYAPHVPSRITSTVIQSMVDLAAFDPSQHWPGDEDLISHLGDSIIVGMIANISPVKGIETFIRVAARAQSSGFDTRFVVIGSVFPSQKDYFIRLKALAEALGATNVVFVGSRVDVRPLLKRFDIYLCTSVSESSPVAVWEAMAMSLPIVSTDVGDVPYFVASGENGYIAPVGDDLALWQATKSLCIDPLHRQQMGVIARARAELTFGRSAIANQTMDLYNHVLAHG